MKNTINFTIKSWKGKRPVNQDSLACAFNKDENFCAIVCDGVGSIRGSENASKIIANFFTDRFSQSKGIVSVTAWFKETLALALNKLTEYAKQHSCPSISTTLAILFIVDKKFYSFNIGDTRVYALTNLKDKVSIKKYSYDHNYKNYLISKGAAKGTIEAAKPKWHALTNLIDAGDHSVANFDVNSGDIKEKTYFLICTDGLYGYVVDEDKIRILTKHYLPLALRLSLLNKKAMSNGSDDNISAILVSVK